MQELQVIVKQKPAEISFNFDEIKQNLSERLEIYKSMEVTEEVLTDRKKDIATLRKIAKAIDDKRKEVKGNYMSPYDEFEKKAKELIEIVNEPIDLINKQVKEYEEKQKAEKKEKALKYFNDNVGEVDITFEEVFSNSWLLTATSYKSIRSDIDTAISNRKADIETIKAMESEVEEKAMATYKTTKRLADALKVINDYERQKAEILRREEERRKAEEERKRQEEERRRRDEEIRKQREEAARKAEEERKKREDVARIEREKQKAIEKAKAEERARIQHELIENAQKEKSIEEFIEPSDPFEGNSPFEQSQAEELQDPFGLPEQEMEDEPNPFEQPIIDSEPVEQLHGDVENIATSQQSTSLKTVMIRFKATESQINAVSDYLLSNNISFVKNVM